MEGKEYSDSTEKPPEVNTKDWSKTMERVEEYLRTFCGLNSVPINYVVRNQIRHIASSDDP